jgi:hypothetical protein
MIFKIALFFVTLVIYDAFFFNFFDLNRGNIGQRDKNAKRENFFNFSSYLNEQAQQEINANNNECK